MALGVRLGKVLTGCWIGVCVCACVRVRVCMCGFEEQEVGKFLYFLVQAACGCFFLSWGLGIATGNAERCGGSRTIDCGNQKRRIKAASWWQPQGNLEDIEGAGIALLSPDPCTYIAGSKGSRKVSGLFFPHSIFLGLGRSQGVHRLKFIYAKGIWLGVFHWFVFGVFG